MGTYLPFVDVYRPVDHPYPAYAKSKSESSPPNEKLEPLPTMSSHACLLSRSARFLLHITSECADSSHRSVQLRDTSLRRRASLCLYVQYLACNISVRRLAAFPEVSKLEAGCQYAPRAAFGRILHWKCRAAPQSVYYAVAQLSLSLTRKACPRQAQSNIVF